MGYCLEWLYDDFVQIISRDNYTPRFNEVERGYTDVTLSVCPLGDDSL